MSLEEAESRIARCLAEGGDSLDLSLLGLSEVPDSIGRLTNLTTLDLGGNQLSEVPDSITQLANLTRLSLDVNQLSEVRDSITQLTNLTQLSLDGNQLSEVPDSITQLTNLTRLYLDRNRLSEVPDSITQLTNLTRLSLDGNQLSEVPDSITQLTNLTQLNLDRNQLSEVPDSITQLTNLTQLNLDRNQLSEVPDSITQLTNLTQLNLDRNQLSEVPDSITQLTNLTRLYLGGNQLSEVPDSITQLTNLTQLNLARNQLSEVPDSIGQLTNLTTLYLDGNQLRWLPVGLADTALGAVFVSSLTANEGLHLGERGSNRFPSELLDAAESDIEDLWEYLRSNDPPTDEQEVEEAPTETEPGFSIREVVPGGVEFQTLPDPDTMLDIRALLEQLVGLATDLIQQGKFEHDPLVEDRIGRDRDSLRYELFENPDGFDATMIAIITQRTLSTIIPVLDDGSQKDLLRILAGVPDRNPQSIEAANAALNKAQAVADALDQRLDEPENLADTLGDILDQEIDDQVTPTMWVAGSLRWGTPVVEGLGLGATIAGTLLALNAGGPISIALGAAIGLLALFRPRKG